MSEEVTETENLETKKETGEPQAASLEDIKAQAEQVDAPEPEEKEASSEKEPSDAKKEEPAAEAEEPEPAYEPNYRFKVMDKEHEFDEFLRPVVKDADAEAKLRELYEKAYGMDHIKSKYQKVKEDFGSIKTEHENMSKNWEYLDSLNKNGDYDNLFKAAGISEQSIYKWVLDKLNYQQMNPEQKQAYDQQVEMRRQNYALQQQNQLLQQQSSDLTLKQDQAELSSALSRPEVQSIVEAFDKRAGKSGAFQDQVISAGLYHYQKTGVDLTPDEAIKQVIALSGITPGESQSAPVPSQAAVATPAQAPATKPTLPTLGGGRSVSPVKRAVKSIADLKKAYDEQYGS